MHLSLLKAKIHRATVTHSELNYEGSIAIDGLLLEATGIREFEQVHIWDVTNGARFSTYAIRAEEGSGIISLNGGAARHVQVGDLIIVAAFAGMSEDEAKTFKPNLVYVDAHNAISHQPQHPHSGRMTHTNGFDALHAHAQRLRGAAIPALLAAEPQRPTQYARQVGPLYFNFARQKYDRAALDALFAIARERDLAGAFQRLFRGEQVNVTEQRAALHTALRGDLTDAPVASDAYATAAEVRQRVGALIQQLEGTDVTDIVSVGIGGSDLGPRLVADALRAPSGARFRVHFVSNVDGAAMQRTLATLDPARTAGILISKTFGTQETLLNGSILHAWLGGSERLYAVSANPERAAKAFDIAPGRVLPMWDWVGGRYSLWSAVGFPVHWRSVLSVLNNCSTVPRSSTRMCSTRRWKKTWQCCTD